MRDLSKPSNTAVVSKAFDILAVRHDSGLSGYNPKNSLYHEATWSAIVQAIGSANRCSVLDIGGGNGLWTIRLARLGHMVVYVDISENMARIAHTNLNKSGVTANVIIGDAHNLDFLPRDYFDVALAVGDLLCYSMTPMEICYHAYNRVKPGGKLVVAVMGRLGVLQHLVEVLSLEQVKEYVSKGWWVEFTEGELGSGASAPLSAHTYTVSELRWLCQSVGWRIVAFFGAGILRTLIGREKLICLIEREGIEAVLDLENELAKSTAFLECAMEFGLIAEKPKSESLKAAYR